MKGSKIEEFSYASTQKELNQVISDYSEDFVSSKINYVIKIYYNVAIKDYNVGPLSIMCMVSLI